MPDNNDQDGLETLEDAQDLPWWEKVSHPDADIRVQGHKEQQQESDREADYGEY
ncbi:MAG: hypothetical protein ICV63_08795 [Coleofasciculus sp. Co-bin14]|nr:hypothetical protein [Coleofasciculus sp. Co-bin14]